MKSFGQLLSKLRQKAGLSQNELAQIIKTNPTHISKIERGERNPPKIKTLTEIAKALNLSKEEMRSFFSSALHSRKSGSQLSYQASKGLNYIDLLVEDEVIKKLLERPSVKLISEILNDKNLSEKEKKFIEEKIVSFVTWLKTETEKTDA